MKAFEAVDIPTGCDATRHVFVSLGTAEEPAVHEFLQPCMCGQESYGWAEVSAWGFPMWAAAKNSEQRNAMAQHVITAAADRVGWRC